MESKTQQLKMDFSGTRPIFRLPLVVRTVTDVKSWRQHSWAVRRLPAAGVKVAIDGLNADSAQKLKARIGAYIRSCGCAEGGACALLALLGVLAVITVRVSAHGVRWGDFGMVVVGLFLSVLFGGLGKLVGLSIARLRFEKCCDEVIRMLDEN